MKISLHMRMAALGLIPSSLMIAAAPMANAADKTSAPSLLQNYGYNTENAASPLENIREVRYLFSSPLASRNAAPANAPMKAEGIVNSTVKVIPIIDEDFSKWTKEQKRIPTPR